jgi:hypothetical protein
MSHYIVVLTFILIGFSGCNEKPLIGGDQNPIEELEKDNDNLPIGAYMGQLNAKKNLVEYKFGDASKNSLSMPIKSSACHLTILDTVILFQPFVERSQSYGVFQYRPIKDKEGFNLEYINTLELLPEDGITIFHTELFTKNLTFEVEQKTGYYLLSSEDFSLELRYLKSESIMLDSLTNTKE